VKKKTGTYYTPVELAGFLVKQALKVFSRRKNISVLEPSVGEGALLSEMIKHTRFNFRGNAFDIDSRSIAKCKEIFAESNINFKRNDFLKEDLKSDYNLIISNPPYVKDSLLDKEQISIIDELYRYSDIKKSISRNLWVAFLLKSISLQSKSGVLATILPSELIQLSSYRLLVEKINETYDSVCIYTFDDLQFECKGQDTIVLIASRGMGETGVTFGNISDVTSGTTSDFGAVEKSHILDSSLKLKHHYLSEYEVSMISDISSEMASIGTFLTSKPGVVTAANDYFILTDEQVKKYRIKAFCTPIIAKAKYVNGSLTYEENDFQELVTENNPTYLLKIKKDSIITPGLRRYLDVGLSKGIQNGYKCSRRTKWFSIPNINKKPSAFFLRRAYKYPKLIINNSRAQITDTGYQIEMKEEFDLRSLIFSFYNSFSLLQVELKGSAYGGGVLELSPKEFKSIKVPTLLIDNKAFEQANSHFHSKSDIADYLNYSDEIILRNNLGMSRKDVSLTKKLLNKVRARRFRN